MALVFFCFRQTVGGFTSRGGSTKKSLEVFCVLVMVSAGVVALVGAYIRDTHRATGVAGVMFADGPRVELLGFHVADAVP